MGLTDVMNRVKFGVIENRVPIMRYSGDALIVVALGTAILGTVKACKSYDKEHNKLLEVKNKYELEEVGKKEVAIGYVKFWASIGKYYIVPAATMIGAFCLHAGAFNQLKAENAMLSSTLSTTIASLESYRERVRAKVGEEEEFKIFNDIHDEEHEVVEEMDPETGKPLHTTAKEEVSGDNTLIYTKGNGSTQTQLFQIKSLENYYNTLLESRKYGIVTKNEVIEALGGAPRGGKEYCLGAKYNPSIIHRIIIQTRVIKQDCGLDSAYHPVYKEVIACEIKGLDDDVSQLI